MGTAIERLRAALVDGEWTAEDRRADALRAMAEIEAEWDRLLAPVDVDAAAEAEARRRFEAMGGTYPTWEEIPDRGRALHVAAARPVVEKLERAKAWARGERAARWGLAAVVQEQRAEIARLKSAPGEACAGWAATWCPVHGVACPPGSPPLAAVEQTASGVTSAVDSREVDAWPVRDVLTKLAAAADVLFERYNYDGDGYEQIAAARDAARVHAAAFTDPAPLTEEEAQRWVDQEKRHDVRGAHLKPARVVGMLLGIESPPDSVDPRELRPEVGASGWDTDRETPPAAPWNVWASWIGCWTCAACGARAVPGVHRNGCQHDLSDLATRDVLLAWSQERRTAPRQGDDVPDLVLGEFNGEPVKARLL